MSKPTEGQVKELERIKSQLLKSACVCPVCKSEIIQQTDHKGSWGRYCLTDCICKNCGVRTAKHKYPTKIIDDYTYAVTQLGKNTYAIDPVGRTYQVLTERRTATYMSGEMGQPGHEYKSGYTVDVLHWIGLIEELWSEPLW